MEITEILPKLHKVKKSGNGWIACCPAHDDDTPSMSVGVGEDGRILLHCQRGCGLPEILDRLGLTEADLFPEKDKKDYGQQEGVYVYPGGKVRKVKTRYRDGHKSYYWQHLDKAGNWINGRGGPPRLYYYPDDIAGAPNMIIVGEGEKVIDRMHEIRLPGISTPDGAGSESKDPWRDEYGKAFEGKHVLILPDNDGPGHDHAEKLAAHIKPLATSLRIIDLKTLWPEIPEKGDFVEFADHAGGVAEAWDKIVNAIDTTPEWTTPEALPATSEDAKEDPPKLECISAKDLMALDIADPAYLVEDMLPDVGAVLLAGASKIGKSWMALQLALCVAMGIPFLEHETMKASVLYLALEDSMRTIRPRLRRQLAALNIGEVPENFNLCFESPNMDNNGLTAVENALKEYPETRLVIVDVLAIFRSYRGGQQMNAYEKDYKILRELKEFADAHGICLLMITHNNKTSDPSDRFNQISGSTGQMGVSDASWILFKNHRDDVDAQLDCTGRAIRGNNYTVRFDDETCIWNFRGESSSLADQFDRENYEQSPLIQTVKLLLADPPHKWQGLSRELLDAGKLRLNTAIAFNSRDVGRKLLEFKADLLRFDGIVYESDKAGRRKFYYADDVDPDGDDLDNVALEELDDDDLEMPFDDVDVD